MKSSWKKKYSDEDSFVCKCCMKLVKLNRKFSGTQFRNHCPFCLYSIHLGQDWPNHVGLSCRGEMKPIGLTFKHEGWDKYGKIKQGELMIVHLCNDCGEITINRLAGDDNPDKVMEVFKKSLEIDESFSKNIENQNIKLLSKKDEDELKRQLFGIVR